jgi:IS5 family transposase
VIRDIERKVRGEMGEQLATLMERAKRIHAQQRDDNNKLYSVHGPEVECISKGKPRRQVPVEALQELGHRATVALRKGA